MVVVSAIDLYVQLHVVILVSVETCKLPVSDCVTVRYDILQGRLVINYVVCWSRTSML